MIAMRIWITQNRVSNYGALRVGCQLDDWFETVIPGDKKRPCSAFALASVLFRMAEADPRMRGEAIIREIQLAGQADWIAPAKEQCAGALRLLDDLSLSPIPLEAKASREYLAFARAMGSGPPNPLSPDWTGLRSKLKRLLFSLLVASDTEPSLTLGRLLEATRVRNVEEALRHILAVWMANPNKESSENETLAHLQLRRFVALADALVTKALCLTLIDRPQLRMRDVVARWAVKDWTKFRFQDSFELIASHTIPELLETLCERCPAAMARVAFAVRLFGARLPVPELHQFSQLRMACSMTHKPSAVRRYLHGLAQRHLEECLAPDSQGNASRLPDAWFCRAGWFYLPTGVKAQVIPPRHGLEHLEGLISDLRE